MLMAILAFALTSARSEPAVTMDFDRPSPQWREVLAIADGSKGGAARFAGPGSIIDAGECSVDSKHPFTLRVALRTNEAGFCTPVMARRGEPVAFSIIMGRQPGRVSFEAWSWGTVKLISATRIDDGRWHSIEVAYEPRSNTAILSVDGRVEASGRLGEGGCATAQLRFGNNIGADQPYRGDIDDFSLISAVEHPERFVGLGPITPADDKARDLAAWRQTLAPRSTTIPADAAAWKLRQAEIRRHVADSLGLTPTPTRDDLEVRVHGSLSGGGVTVSRVSFNSWPGYRATAWLWQADVLPEGRRPAMFMPHGHWAGGAIDPVIQVRAARFARAGYVVLVPDSVHVEDVATGVNSVGAMTWNNIRAIDYLMARPDVDPARLGVTGASGGAQQTMYLMALEDRIAAAAPVCMICYYQEILDERSAHCGCNHVPRIASGVDQPEMCAAFAPRPVLFVSVTGDWTHRFLEQGLPEIKRLYHLAGAGAAVESLHLTSGHDYSSPMRNRAYTFFDSHLAPPHPEASEDGFRAFPADALLKLGPSPRPPDRGPMSAEYIQRRPRASSLAELAPALPWRAVEAKWTDVEAGEPGSSWRPALVTGVGGVRLPVLAKGVVQGRRAPITVVVTPLGKAGLLLQPPNWLQKLDGVVILEPRYHGEWGEFASAWSRNGLLLGCGTGYVAAHDIAAVVQALPAETPVRVVALGECGVESLIATSITARIGSLIVEDVGPSYAASPDRQPQLSDIRRFGDVPALVGLVPPTCHATIGGFREPVAGPLTRPQPLTAAEIEAALSN